jgi:pyridoxal phosphate enzyme (YggS family)
VTDGLGKQPRQKEIAFRQEAMNGSELKALLSERIRAVRQRIEAACRRAGRASAGVTLVAVTKTVEPEIAALLPSLGVNDLGESRPQELWRKAAALPATVKWHLVGHLQRNKIERTLPLAHCIHSVDSVRLLDALEQEAAKIERTLPVFLEVNASGEASKHGFTPAEAAGLGSRIKKLRHLEVLGLMTMAAFEETPGKARSTFVALRESRDRLRQTLQAPDSLPHLSMGMTNDFEVAIEEGATFVRIGTALFEGLPG